MLLRIRQERLSRHWTQEFVANQAEITVPAVQYLETGKCKPSYDVLVKLEDLFQMGHRELFEAATSSIEKQPGGNRAEPTTKE